MTILPGARTVRILVEGMVGRAAEVTEGRPALAGDLPRTLLAAYVDDAGRLAAVIGQDLPLAAWLAAALGLVPAGAAEDSVADGALTDTLAENAAEVCNMFGTLLNRDGRPHLRLAQVVLPGDKLPPDAVGRLLALGNRLDLVVTVSGYGTGRFWLSAA